MWKGGKKLQAVATSFIQIHTLVAADAPYTGYMTLEHSAIEYCDVIGQCLDFKSPVWLLRIQSAHLEGLKNIGNNPTSIIILFT